MPSTSLPRLPLAIFSAYATTTAASCFLTNTVSPKTHLPSSLIPTSPTKPCLTTMPSRSLSNDDRDEKKSFRWNAMGDSIGKAALIALTSATLLTSPGASLADEIGREVEAPTLFTGESVEICVKRGPLGACQKTETRTAANDNDKAAKYFKGKDKVAGTAGEETSEDESELMTRLKRKTEDNREKNEQAVKIKTFENDQAANFGPFDRQVVILNTDGKTFTLLQNPQAMRLKKSGYIVGRKFVEQPSQEVLDRALESEEGIGDFFKGLLGDK